MVSHDALHQAISWLTAIYNQLQSDIVADQTFNIGTSTWSLQSYYFMTSINVKTILTADVHLVCVH